MSEPANVADLRDEADGRNKRDPTQRLERGREIAVDPKPTRAGFVHEAQPPGWRPTRADDVGDRLQVTPHDPVVADLAVSAPLGERESIESLWTSSPTNMLRFAMACLRCVWRVARHRHWQRVTHEYNVTQVSS